MRNTFVGLLASATLLTGAIHAAEPSSAAQTRAGLYQAEVGAGLTQHGWRILSNEPGKLVVDRPYNHENGTSEFIVGDNSFAHLTVDFRPDGKTHTVSNALASRYIYQQWSSPLAQRLLYPPLALRDPKLAAEYQEILAGAEMRLATGHPGYAAPATQAHDGKNVSVRLAMR